MHAMTKGALHTHLEVHPPQERVPPSAVQYLHARHKSGAAHAVKGTTATELLCPLPHCPRV